jgi:hypothetical protein
MGGVKGMLILPLPGIVPKLNRTRPISADDFKNGQKTPCLRTARTYAILTTNP